MTRLPHGFPAPWFTADAGGAADLQTDVMRFMAILALCLVAIFALVQAVPVEQPPAAKPPEPVAPVREMPPPVARVEQLVAPAAEPATVEPSKAPAAREPVPAAAAPPAPAPTPAAASPAEDGYTLRFESDVALKSLVARGEVGLYAMQDDDARRLRLESGRPVFWQASMPSAFHEMEAATVPADIAAAAGRIQGDAVRWGVTLPPRLSREIDARVSGGGSGELVIAASGALRRGE